MPIDMTNLLWTGDGGGFYRDRKIALSANQGQSLVCAVLAMLTGGQADDFRETINQDNPVTWSEALRPSQMKLAYCPTDVRRLRFYLPELLDLDDLFLVSVYTVSNPDALLANPDPSGFVCESDLFVLHRDRILDPRTGMATAAMQHPAATCHTKHIFRVVPADSDRGL